MLFLEPSRLALKSTLGIRPRSSSIAIENRKTNANAMSDHELDPFVSSGCRMCMRRATAGILIFLICLPYKHCYAIDSGTAQALTALGFAYEKGKGVPQSYKKAAELYEKAAAAGDAGGEAALANFYMRGLGVPKDYHRAFDLAKKSAVQGNPAGETNLGVLYRHGWGVKQDCNKAVALYTKAADEGYAGAIANLAALYMNGLCVPRNEKKAAELLQKAIAKGYHDANQAAPNTQPR
jgi:TPR repeat protein